MPSFLQQYVDAIISFRDFSGNATRKDFWSFAAVHLAIVVLLMVLNQGQGEMRRRMG